MYIYIYSAVADKSDGAVGWWFCRTRHGRNEKVKRAGGWVGKIAGKHAGRWFADGWKRTCVSGKPASGGVVGGAALRAAQTCFSSAGIRGSRIHDEWVCPGRDDRKNKRKKRNTLKQLGLRQAPQQCAQDETSRLVPFTLSGAAILISFARQAIRSGTFAIFRLRAAWLGMHC
jgi:hypothetical protein